MLHTIKLLNTTITAESDKKILEYVVDRVQKGKGSRFNRENKLFITTPNPEILVYAQDHPEYQKVLNEAEVALPDGVGLLIGGYLMGRPIKERITGTDFIEKLCVACREKPMYMGFLGGRGGVAELTAERLKKKYPWINVVWVGEEWGTGKNDAFRSSSAEAILAQGPAGRHPRPTSSVASLPAGARRGTPTPATLRNNQGIDILFVAYGFPKQEEWIYKNLPDLPVKVAMGVGGAFDYISGRVPRAPKFVRAIGLEWLFRLLVQPWRWKRQLALVKFVLLILKERFTKKQ